MGISQPVRGYFDSTYVEICLDFMDFMDLMDGRRS
jgi:hypothetical protein